jgi:hypothetical protein
VSAGGCSCSEKARRAADGLDPPPSMEEREDISILLAAGLMKKKDVPFVTPCTHRSRVINEQHAFAYSLCVVDRFGRVAESESYSGEDAAEVFLARLLALEEKYLTRFLKGEGGVAATEEAKRQAAASRPGPHDYVPCYLCGRYMGADAVLDHDHVDGSFLGWAHNGCNLRRKEVLTLPVMAHNFSSFDGHLLMREVEKVRSRLRNRDPQYGRNRG